MDAVSSFLSMYLTRRGVPSQLFDPRSHSRPLQRVSPELRRLEAWATIPTTLLLLNVQNPLVPRLAQLEDHIRTRAALSTRPRQRDPGPLPRAVASARDAGARGAVR